MIAPKDNLKPGSPRVVVVGGGLAGMAAAVALEASGVAVTLVEARKTLGGRAGSFEDPQSGETLDNCQHVLLGCCTNLLDFYRRLGVESFIRHERRVHFLNASGRRFDLFGINPLPAPLHLGFAFASFGLLTLAERVALTKAMFAMASLGRAGREKLADVPFGEWLDEQRQPASLVEKLYAPVLVSALNELPRLASAAAAIHVFQDAMLAHSAGYTIGLPDRPLGELYRTLPCSVVRLATRVNTLEWTGRRVTGATLSSGQTLACDAVVLATNHHALGKWIPDDLATGDSRFGGLAQLQSVPILGAHLWFDRPILAMSHAALVHGPLQWLFRKDAGGSAVHGVISAAREWVGVPHETCLREFEAQIREVLPAARDAKLLRGVVVVEKRATFSPNPGSDALRPPQAPAPAGLPNVYLAGDYTRTGWPATMEGAVRSGYLAAEAIAERLLGRRVALVQPDLEAQWPYRWLSGEGRAAPTRVG